MILTERKRRPTHRDGGFGKLVHPTDTAGTGKVRRIELTTINVNEIYYRCKNCGFHCLGSRVQSPGETPDGNGSVVIGASHEPNVKVGGCPFCGSANSKAA